jgi:hypothetical protein
LKLKYPKSGQLLLRHPNLIAHQYRHADKDQEKRNPKLLWIRSAGAALSQARSLIVAQTPPERWVVHPYAEEEQAKLELQLEEKEPTLREVLTPCSLFDIYGIVADSICLRQLKTCKLIFLGVSRPSAGAVHALV